MNYKILFIYLLAVIGLGNAHAQSTLDAVLISVEKNNKTLAAEHQFWEAQKLEFKTGLTLSDPTIQGQYLFGSPAAAGDQTDIFVVQPFDFPTTYKKRRELAAAQGAVSSSKIAMRRQEILVEAKLVCIEMVYRNKLKAQYDRRESALEKLLGDFQFQLEKGDGNILDVNKTRLQLLEINQLGAENAVGIQKLQLQLSALNGGQTLVFQDTIYPQLPEIQSFDILEKEYQAADPLRQTLEQEKRIAQKQLELAKAWQLPRFEAGYHYQGILGQRFNGLHAGVTLPIWEHKYRRQTQQAQVFFTDLQLNSHLNEQFYYIKEVYDRQVSLRKSLEEYSSAISSVSNEALLSKALQLGEITTIEYFMEMSFYQNAMFHFLKTERDYHVAVAELMQFKM